MGNSVYSLTHSTYTVASLVPRPIPSFSVLHAENPAAYNTEKLGEPGDEASTSTLYSVFVL